MLSPFNKPGAKIRARPGPSPARPEVGSVEGHPVPPVTFWTVAAGGEERSTPPPPPCPPPPALPRSFPRSLPLARSLARSPPLYPPPSLSCSLSALRAEIARALDPTHTHAHAHMPRQHTHALTHVRTQGHSEGPRTRLRALPVRGGCEGLLRVPREPVDQGQGAARPQGTAAPVRAHPSFRVRPSHLGCIRVAPFGQRPLRVWLSPSPSGRLPRRGCAC